MDPNYTTRNTFPDIDTKTLKSLYNAHRSIRTLCALWILGAAIIAIALLVVVITPGTKDVNKPLSLAIFVPILAFYVATIVGCYKRTSWGRICGIIACIFALLGFPIGTLIGILGLLAFGKSKRLFGPDAIDPDELTLEYKKRKAAKI